MVYFLSNNVRACLFILFHDEGWHKGKRFREIKYRIMNIEVVISKDFIERMKYYNINIF